MTFLCPQSSMLAIKIRTPSESFYMLSSDALSSETKVQPPVADLGDVFMHGFRPVNSEEHQYLLDQVKEKEAIWKFKSGGYNHWIWSPLKNELMEDRFPFFVKHLSKDVSVFIYFTKYDEPSYCREKWNILLKINYEFLSDMKMEGDQGGLSWISIMPVIEFTDMVEASLGKKLNVMKKTLKKLQHHLWNKYSRKR